MSATPEPLTERPGSTGAFPAGRTQPPGDGASTVTATRATLLVLRSPA